MPPECESKYDSLRNRYETILACRLTNNRLHTLQSVRDPEGRFRHFGVRLVWQIKQDGLGGGDVDTCFIYALEKGKIAGETRASHLMSLHFPREIGSSQETLSLTLERGVVGLSAAVEDTIEHARGLGEGWNSLTLGFSILVVKAVGIAGV